MGKKTRNKDKDPHSDLPGGHALFRLRQMELERGLPKSDDVPEEPGQDDGTKGA
jgi:hypothetical protein